MPRILLIAGAAATFVAQQDPATITGTVNDPPGIAALQIGDDGQCSAPNLPIRDYEVLVREPMTLRVSQVVRIDAGMEVGVVAESIDIRAETPPIQTHTPEFGTVFRSRSVTGLPLAFAGGRYAENFGRNEIKRAFSPPVWNWGRIDMSPINQPNAINEYINTAAFVDPVSIGGCQRVNTSHKLSEFCGLRELSKDFSVQRNFRVFESIRIQLRADFLNAFNRTLWGNIEVNAASPLFGKVAGAGDWDSPRKIQLVSAPIGERSH